MLSLLVLTGQSHIFTALFIPPGHDRLVSYFWGFFGCWLVVSHTLGFGGAWAWEIWWNPYARCPDMRGRVSEREEANMLEAGRERVREIWEGRG